VHCCNCFGNEGDSPAGGIGFPAGVWEHRKDYPRENSEENLVESKSLALHGHSTVHVNIENLVKQENHYQIIEKNQNSPK
jgi:hypothetical protein